MKKSLLYLLPILLLVACSPGAPSEVDIQTAIAQTVTFEDAVAQAVSTGIAATVAAFPTSTATETPRPTQTFAASPTHTATIMPTETPADTPTSTIPATETLIPTVTQTPEPTETATPTAGELKIIRLYTAINYLETYAKNIYEGLTPGVPGLACSLELRDSLVTNYDRIASLETFNDELLSTRATGANIYYASARKKILGNEALIAAVSHCREWIAAGKPDNFASSYEGVAITPAFAAVEDAINTAQKARNN